MVKVSICIPTYNQVEFLSKNIDSIINQTFQNFEVIVSDDSTNDNVAKLVKDKFEGKTIPYRYHKNEQALGSPANWNKAISMAQGEYIKIMHHDDWFSHENSLSELVQMMDENPNADLGFCASKVFNVQTQSESTHEVSSLFIEALKKDPLLLFNNNQIGAPSAVIYRNKAGLMFDQRLSYLVDVDFYLRVLEQNASFVYTAKPLVVNTSNNPDQVTAKSINKITQIGEYCYLYHKHLFGIFPTKKWRVFYRDLFAWYGLKKFTEIEQHGYPVPEPKWMFQFLLWQSKLK